MTAIGTTSGARAHRLPLLSQLRTYACDARTAGDDPKQTLRIIAPKAKDGAEDGIWHASIVVSHQS